MKQIVLSFAALLPIGLLQLMISVVVSPTAATASPTASTPTSGPFQVMLDQVQQSVAPRLPGLGGIESFLPKPDPLAYVHLVIKLSDRRVYVYERDQVKTSFPVAIGRAGWETPTGSYHVLQMFRNPAWQHPFTGEVMPPGADNPLGSRWIGFWTDGTNFIGFHGTPNVESVGRPASHGCIRMYDQDVVKLFEKVKVGTPVEVVP
jgi:L,D-transpeptidase ErfK/SrfK